MNSSLTTCSSARICPGQKWKSWWAQKSPGGPSAAERTGNTLAHTNGPGTVRFWATADEVVCQVQDQGQISDPLSGTARPAPDAPGGGRGLRLVREVCDRVEMPPTSWPFTRSSSTATAIWSGASAASATTAGRSGKSCDRA